RSPLSFTPAISISLDTWTPEWPSGSPPLPLVNVPAPVFVPGKKVSVVSSVLPDRHSAPLPGSPERVAHGVPGAEPGHPRHAPCQSSGGFGFGGARLPRMRRGHARGIDRDRRWTEQVDGNRRTESTGRTGTRDTGSSVPSVFGARCLRYRFSRHAIGSR